MPTISVIIFYILAILGGITIIYGLISLSVFFNYNRIGSIICSTFIKKRI